MGELSADDSFDVLDAYQHVLRLEIGVDDATFTMEIVQSE